MNSVLFEASYINLSGFQYIVFVICVILALFLCLGGLVRIDRKMRIKGIRIGALRILEMAVLFIIVIGIITTIEEYFNIVVKYKTGHYLEVEGIVEDYSFISGRMGTTFTIDGVEFHCPSSAWGYEPTDKRNPEIKENGQYLKIKYISDEIQGNVIVYIEEVVDDVKQESKVLNE